MTRSAGLAGMLLIACSPDLSQDDWLVLSTRVLAIRSEPAEAKPGTPLTFTAFLANPPGASEVSTVLWRWCTAPKPPTENNVVSARCLDATSLVDAGTGLSMVTLTPFNACSLFGPNAPPGGFRPRDPDSTGGYYQPLRIDVPGAVPAILLERVLCDLADASSELATEFGYAYVPNANPHFAPMVARVGAQAVSIDAIPSGARVVLEASWSASDAETYAYFDRALQTIVSKRESMRVAWYVTAGKLDTESTGRGENDPMTLTSNVWTAPTTPGVTQLWVVLRDSRGGIDLATYDLTVSP